MPATTPPLALRVARCIRQPFDKRRACSPKSLPHPQPSSARCAREGDCSFPACGGRVRLGIRGACAAPAERLPNAAGSAPCKAGMGQWRGRPGAMIVMGAKKHAYLQANISAASRPCPATKQSHKRGQGWARLVARCTKPKNFTKVCRLLLGQVGILFIFLVTIIEQVIASPFLAEPAARGKLGRRVPSTS